MASRVGAAVVSDDEDDIDTFSETSHPPIDSSSAPTKSPSSGMSAKEEAAAASLQVSKSVKNSKIDSLWASLQSNEGSINS
jgi:hypothetical protein